MLQQSTKPISLDYQTLLFALLAVLSGIGMGMMTIALGSPALVAVFALSVILVIITLVHPEFGIAILTVMTFTRVSDILVAYHHAPSTVQPFMVLLVFSAGLYYVRARRRPVGLQQVVVCLLLYGFVVFLSLIYAKDLLLAEAGLESYVKDAFVAFLVVLLVQNVSALRQVIWALLFVGIVLGTLSVYQYVTGTYSNTYWGFAQALLSNLPGESGYRLGGPFRDSPFFGQILLVFVPLALNRLTHERQLWLRCLAGWCLAVSVLTIILTYSRGAFLGLIVMGALMVIRRPPRPIAFAIGLGLITAVLTLAPGNYVDRIGTIAEFAPVVGVSDVRNESSFRGRTSENIVAIQLFLDNPLLGVGVGNYNAHYVEYSSRLGMDPRLKNRSAHNLFLEVLAESGVIGLGVFLGILYVAFKAMHRARRSLEHGGLGDIASMVQAISVALLGYLTASAFLHLAFARPFWLLIGLALATTQIAQYELAQRAAANEPTL